MQPIPSRHGPKVPAALLIPALAVLAGGPAILAGCGTDDAAAFRERKGRITGVETAGEESAERKSFRTLVGSTGLRVECGILAPADSGRRVPAIVVLGGKATGKHAVDYALGIDDALIVAVDYPYEPRQSYTIPEFLADVPAMRRALLDMVPSVMLVLDYLSTRPDVDTSRIVLLGYSFGAPLIPAIAAQDRRAALAAMVYGGGDLHQLIRHNVRRSENALVAEIVAGLGALLLRPLEPLRYAADVSPVPSLMINGTEDEQIPRACTEALYNALREPKEILWVDSRHVHPRNVELTRTILGLLRSELAERRLLNPP